MFTYPVGLGQAKEKKPGRGCNNGGATTYGTDGRNPRKTCRGMIAPVTVPEKGRAGVPGGRVVGDMAGLGTRLY